MSGPGLVILTALRSEAAAIGPEARVIGVRASLLRPQAPPPRIVVVAGLGGGLHPSLGCGDLIVDDPAGIVPALPRITRGRIYTAPGIIGSPAEKRALFERTGAACADMEQELVRAWAPSAAIVGIRAICDTAAESLDPALLDCVDAVGTPRPGRIAALLLRRPGVLADMLRLRRASGAALRALGPAVRDIAARIRI